MAHPWMSAAQRVRSSSLPEGAVLASDAMGLRREHRAAAARQSWVVRLFYDTEGDLRGWRALAVVGVLAATVVLGTVIVSLAGAAFGPQALSIGALVVFLAIKIPLLGFVFWVLMRKGGGYTQVEMSAVERSRVLASLLEQARTAKGAADEADRLRWASREAWRIADEAPDAERQRAIAVAVEIGGMAPVRHDSARSR